MFSLHQEHQMLWEIWLETDGDWWFFDVYNGFSNCKKQIISLKLTFHDNEISIHLSTPKPRWITVKEFMQLEDIKINWKQEGF